MEEAGLARGLAGATAGNSRDELSVPDLRSDLEERSSVFLPLSGILQGARDGFLLISRETR